MGVARGAAEGEGDGGGEVHQTLPVVVAPAGQEEVVGDLLGLAWLARWVRGGGGAAGIFLHVVIVGVLV